MNTEYVDDIIPQKVLYYHAGCPDGWASCLSFYMKYGKNMEYIAIYHDTVVLPSDCSGKEVYMCDIALSRMTMEDIRKQAKSFICLDHHITAYNELKDLEYCHFDMTHSGCHLAWKFCFPNAPVPKLIQYIEDRDLWKFELKHTEEILCVVDSYPKKKVSTFRDDGFKDLEEWKKLLYLMDGDPIFFENLTIKGGAILKYCKTLRSSLKHSVYRTNICGYDVPIINAIFFKSEILSEICKNEPFSAGYHFNGEKYIFSLRSTDESIDVSEIASRFPGGGGHRNASGFSIKNLDELKCETVITKESKKYYFPMNIIIAINNIFKKLGFKNFDN